MLCFWIDVFLMLVIVLGIGADIRFVINVNKKRYKY